METLISLSIELVQSCLNKIPIGATQSIFVEEVDIHNPSVLKFTLHETVTNQKTAYLYRANGVEAGDEQTYTVTVLSGSEVGKETIVRESDLIMSVFDR